MWYFQLFFGNFISVCDAFELLSTDERIEAEKESIVRDKREDLIARARKERDLKQRIEVRWEWDGIRNKGQWYWFYGYSIWPRRRLLLLLLEVLRHMRGLMRKKMKENCTWHWLNKLSCRHSLKYVCIYTFSIHLTYSWCGFVDSYDWTGTSNVRTHGCFETGRCKTSCSITS